MKFQPIIYFSLFGYSNSDWAESNGDMKSTLGYYFTFCSGVFSWRSKKQEVITQSTIATEYVAAVATTNQAIWLRKLMTDLYMEQKDIT